MTLTDKIKTIFQEESLFIICSHVGPDGDNIGSSCALTRYLRDIGKEAYYLMDEALLENHSFLYKDCGYFSSEEVKYRIGSRPYVAVVLDCSEQTRIQGEEAIFRQAKIKINIDHHETNKGFGDYNLLKKKSSSTCQVLWELLEEIAGGDISPQIATCLYTGLITDSGNFMYSSADASSLEAGAKLLAKGADKNLIMDKLFRSRPLGMLKLLTKVLATLEMEEQVAGIHMTRAMLDETGMDYNEAENLVNYAIEIEGVNIGYFIKEKQEGLIKVSFRSKDETYNVSKIASTIGGGGHIMASGCTIHGDIETAKYIVENSIKEYLQDV